MRFFLLIWSDWLSIFVLYYGMSRTGHMIRGLWKILYVSSGAEYKDMVNQFINNTYISIVEN